MAYPVAPAPRLTRRQQEVGDLIAKGNTDAQIARELGISQGGVRVHIRRLFDLTGSSNRAEAAARVLADGIIAPTGRTVVKVDDLRVLMAALRRAERECPAIAGVAARFEAAYPVLGATASPGDATLVGNSHPKPHSIPCREEAL